MYVSGGAVHAFCINGQRDFIYKVTRRSIRDASPTSALNVSGFILYAFFSK